MESWGELKQMFQDEAQKLVSKFTEEVHRIRQNGVDLEQLKAIKLEVYEGSLMPLYQVATITIKDALTALISPWDTNIISKIEEALKENLQSVRIAVKSEGVLVAYPPLTEESLKKIVKQLRDLTENYRQRLRKLRNSYKAQLDEAKNRKEISDDAYYKSIEQLDTLSKKAREQIEKIAQEKEHKILMK